MSTATAPATAPAETPVGIDAVRLTVRDLAGTAAFYEAALGLARLSGDGTEVALGAGGRAFLHLTADPAARPRDPAAAGLFHTAFLLPARADLGAWVRHAAETGLRLEGASDHLVSEAIYLSDPEGNGIEIYADRPRSTWAGPDGRLRMATERLDLSALARAASAPWAGAPAGTVVGHVHLQVGDAGAAEGFFSGPLGMQIMARYPGAVFASWGGYHHHLAGNVWNSRGVGPRRGPEVGLAEVTLAAAPEAFAALATRLGDAAAPATQDPWGTRLRVVPGSAA